MKARLPARPTVAVVGATGAVGEVMLDILKERNFPAKQVVAVASERSAGREIPFGREFLTVQALKDAVFAGVDLVLLDTPDEVARQWAPRAVEAGAIVVDNSAAWRAEQDVPLVVPEINPDAVLGHRGIIASANCTTIGVVVPLWALHRRFGVKRVVVSSYQATSGAGRPGVDELSEQVLKLADQIDGLGRKGADSLAPKGETFTAPIAFNVVPQIGSFRDNGYTGEELKLSNEAIKIMELPDLQLTATCVRVPTVVGHGSSVYAEFAEEVDLEQARLALSEAAGVELNDLPHPLAAVGTDPCHIGRVRRDLANPNALWFFSVMDNLRKGAALNTVQIAELLLGE